MVEVKKHAGVYAAPLTPMNSDQRITEVQSKLSSFSRIPALKAIVGWQTDKLDWGYARPPLRRLNAKEQRKLHDCASGLGLLPVVESQELTKSA